MTTTTQAVQRRLAEMEMDPDLRALVTALLEEREATQNAIERWRESTQNADIASMFADTALRRFTGEAE